MAVTDALHRAAQGYRDAGEVAAYGLSLCTRYEGYTNAQVIMAELI